MPPPDAALAMDPVACHRSRAEAARERREALERATLRVSLARLLAFVALVILGVSAYSDQSSALLAAAALSAVAFFALVFHHARLHERLRDSEIREAIHRRHLLRILGGWQDLPTAEGPLVTADHPYARDIDLIGPGSLMQRIDVTHTERGARTLVSWLSAPAGADSIRRRAEAVRELAADVDLREELEAAAEVVSGDAKLDARPFLSFVRHAPAVDTRWVPLIHIAPPLLLGLFVASMMGALPSAAWTIPLLFSAIAAFVGSARARDSLDLVSARRGYVEAFRRLLVTVENAEFEAELLVELRGRVEVDGHPPSRFMARLDRWAGLAELRTQFLVHFFVNIVLLWDLHVLYRLERWSRDVGEGLEDVFEALAELEALASLATLAHGDPDASFPELLEPGSPLEATALGHPLLPPSERVANDLRLRGPGSALIITGSNMAGKSTLLRAVGLNLALGLAGGPVIAGRLRMPRVELRASMRVDDDLQRGASYFHAELTKLKGVVADPAGDAPLFFLLDELLRGTNARARHLGARAVLDHLLDRGAMGLAATHDVALARMEDEAPERVGNVHFTDVMEAGEMVFDYRLQDGVVKSSNALRLLAMAGIELPEGVTDGEAERLDSGDT